MDSTLVPAGDELKISSAEFGAVQRWAFEHFGLDLREGKQSLVVARLSKILRRRGLHSFREYLEVLESEPGDQAAVELIDALTTNHTSFFREPEHFEFLTRQILPSFRNSRDHIRIWSAACSSGEEPYSIAFCILEALGMGALSRIEILATDISTRVLDRARAALYRVEATRDLPDALMRRCFLRGTGRAEGWLKVRPEIVAQIRFERLNLIDSWSCPRSYPLIFCRNVMIYFNKPTQAKVVERLSNCLEPGGFLFVGHAESLSGVRHRLEYVKPAIYRQTAMPAADRGKW